MKFIYYVTRRNNYQFTHFKEFSQIKLKYVKSLIICMDMLSEIIKIILKIILLK